MALLFMEGFENYSTVDEMYEDSRYFEEVSGSATFPSGRVVGKSMSIAASSPLEVECYLDNDSSGTLLVGFGIKLGAAGSVSVLISFCSEFQSAGSPAIIIYINTSNEIVLGKSTGETLVKTSALSSGTWYYVEFKIVIDDVTGSAECFLNGSSVDSASSIDTLASGTSAINFFTIEGGSVALEIDDLYIADSSGSGVTDVVGPVVIERLLPTGAGSSTQFTPLSGSNFENVDDGSADDDTSYNSTSTSGNKDLFTHDGITGSVGSVHAVQLTTRIKKVSPGTRTIGSITRVGGTEATNGDFGAIAGSYLFNSQFQELDPNGAAWTESSVNSMEFGYELTN